MTAATAHASGAWDVAVTLILVAFFFSGIVLVIQVFARRDRRHAERLRRDHDEAAKYRDGNGDQQ